MQAAVQKFLDRETVQVSGDGNRDSVADRVRSHVCNCRVSRKGGILVACDAAPGQGTCCCLCLRTPRGSAVVVLSCGRQWVMCACW
jgi:hypothetical protein